MSLISRNLYSVVINKFLWWNCVNRPCRQCVWWPQPDLHPSTTTGIRRESRSYRLSNEPSHVFQWFFLSFILQSVLVYIRFIFVRLTNTGFYDVAVIMMTSCSALVTIPSDVQLSLVVKDTVFSCLSNPNTVRYVMKHTLNTTITGIRTMDIFLKVKRVNLSSKTIKRTNLTFNF